MIMIRLGSDVGDISVGQDLLSYYDSGTSCIPDRGRCQGTVNRTCDSKICNSSFAKTESHLKLWLQFMAILEGTEILREKTDVSFLTTLVAPNRGARFGRRLRRILMGPRWLRLVEWPLVAFPGGRRRSFGVGVACRGPSVSQLHSLCQIHCLKSSRFAKREDRNWKKKSRIS